MALSIPAMTWLKQASLLLLLAGVAIVRARRRLLAAREPELGPAVSEPRHPREFLEAGTRTASRETQRLANPAAARTSAIVRSDRPAAGHCLKPPVEALKGGGREARRRGREPPARRRCRRQERAGAVRPMPITRPRLLPRASIGQIASHSAPALRALGESPPAAGNMSHGTSMEAAASASHG